MASNLLAEVHQGFDSKGARPPGLVGLQGIAWELGRYMQTNGFPRPGAVGRSYGLYIRVDGSVWIQFGRNQWHIREDRRRGQRANEAKHGRESDGSGHGASSR
jgi:hypothetical protein